MKLEHQVLSHLMGLGTHEKPVEKYVGAQAHSLLVATKLVDQAPVLGSAVALQEVHQFTASALQSSSLNVGANIYL
jgi:hypothetical protein